MKKTLPPLIIFFIIFVGQLSYSKIAFPQQMKTLKIQGANFDALWAKVDSLDRQGLTRSSLEAVTEIYTLAKKHNDQPQLIKSIIYKSNYETVLQEYADENTLKGIEKEILSSSGNLKSLLHSILAQGYTSYFEKNRHTFYERSKLADYNNTELAHWDLYKLQEEIIRHYNLSLKDKNQLQNTPITTFSLIVKQGSTDSRKIRPSLYDFLAFRALHYLSSSEALLTHPKYKIEITEDVYFSNATTFANLELSFANENNPQSIALKTYQELLTYHSSRNSVNGLVDADLSRLKFVYDNSSILSKDSLYLHALKTLYKKHNSHPSATEILHEIASFHYGKGVYFNPNNSIQFKTELHQAYLACVEAINTSPNAYGSGLCKALLNRIEEKSLSLQIEKINPNNALFRGLLQYRNIERVYIKIASLPEEFEVKKYENLVGEELIRYYLNLDISKSWEVALPKDADFNPHSVEIQFPELNYGHYVILISDNKDFDSNKNAICYNSIWISSLSYLAKNFKNESAEIVVLNRETGHPIEGAEMWLWHQSYNSNQKKYELIKGDHFKSNNEGKVLVRKKLPNIYNYFIELKLDNDRLFSDNGIYLYKQYENKQSLHPKTYFFTDRAIYRPGQSIYFKGIVLENDGNESAILSDHIATVGLYDVTNKKIAELEIMSNEYGTFSGEFLVPANALTGQFYISDGHGNAYIQIEEYKRPKFKLDFVSLEGAYKINEEIKVTGNTSSYSGVPIQNSTVKYRVIRKALQNTSNWSRFLPIASPESEIISGTTITDNKGNFKVFFLAIPDQLIDPEKLPVFTYFIYLDVTDHTGETQSAITSVNVGYQSALIDSKIPETINREAPFSFEISALNLNSKKIEAELECTFFKLIKPSEVIREKYWPDPDKHLFDRTEYKSYFPLDIYNKNDYKNNWQRKKIASYKINTATSNLLVIEDISKWEQGEYVVVINFNDSILKPSIKEYTHFISLYSLKEKKATGSEIFQVYSIKQTYEPGEKSLFLISGTSENMRVLIEKEVRGKIIDAQWISLNKEQKKHEVLIEEGDRGNITLHFTCVHKGRVFSQSQLITVPYTNKKLDIQFASFRNKLYPGEKEQWKLIIKKSNGEKAMAEMLATLYDASLDVFRVNEFYFDIYKKYSSIVNWEHLSSFGANGSSLYAPHWNTYYTANLRIYDQINWFGFDGIISGGHLRFFPRSTAQYLKSPEIQQDAISSNYNKPEDKDASNASLLKTTSLSSYSAQEVSHSSVQVRKNFSETAFFYPHLKSNKEGEIIIDFTIPEALTKWKMLGIAHTKNLSYGTIKKEIVTQKEVMVTSHFPRFLREDDLVNVSAKIDNLTDKNILCSAKLYLINPTNLEAIDSLFGNSLSVQKIPLEKSSSQSIVWSLKIPAGVDAVTYRIEVKSEQHSDGEEGTIPVLRNKVLLIESLPFTLKGKQNKSFSLEKLKNAKASSTLSHHNLSLEYTANPIWNAVQALPYLMEFPHECSEQLFARYYANSIASQIANSQPKIKQVFEQWKKEEKNETNSLLSQLEKNQQLKSILLEESPWLIEAQDEADQKKRIALLFDLQKMAREKKESIDMLKEIQLKNGGFSWFSGMPDDRFITQHIVAGLGQLIQLGLVKKEDPEIQELLVKAIHYLDQKMNDDYQLILDNKSAQTKNYLPGIQIHYLYARSFFIEYPLNKNHQVAFNYYKDLSKKHWLKQGIYMQALTALFIHRYEKSTLPPNILKSIKEKSIRSEEFGMYWKEIESGYNWYNAPIEAQSLLIEAFHEITQDKNTISEMKIWLLKQKQTQHWKSTKATASACYALLITEDTLIKTESNTTITIGEKILHPEKIAELRPEAGSGYFKTSWGKNEISTAMATLNINKTDSGLAWGSLYWQYFDKLDNITESSTGLKITKKLYREIISDSGKKLYEIFQTDSIKIGETITVRLQIETDRSMDYVHLKDLRGAGLEPIEILSGYKYKDGLGYYQSHRDVATNFFFSYLPKGKYIFEYPLRATFSGNFSNGFASIQSMYVPEFTSNSEGIKIKIITP